MILRLSVINIVGATVGLLEALVVLVDKIVLSEEQLRTLAWFFEAYACELERQASAVGKPFLLEAARLFAMPIRSAPLQESAARIRQVLSPPPPALKPGKDSLPIVTRLTLLTLLSAQAPVPTAASSISELENRAPGGRHNNDDPNYRLIASLPTVEEALCRKEPFLPTPGDRWPLLDRLFRLLREDVVSTLRDAIDALMPPSGADKTKSKRRIWKYENVELHGFEPVGQDQMCFKVSFTLPNSHPGHHATLKKKNDRIQFWQFGPARRPLRVTRLCLLRALPSRVDLS